MTPEFEAKKFKLQWLVIFVDDSYWTSRENSLEMIELSSINKVS